jgi:hypothetical protein
MSERIHELLHRNLQEVFGEGDPPAVVPRFRSCIRTTACSMCRLEFSSGMMH